MLYRILEIDELVSLKNADRAMVDLMENNDSHLKLIALKKHEKIAPHASKSDVCIYVIDGELELTFHHNEACGCTTCGCEDHEKENHEKKYKIKKEQLFLFEKDVMHSVEALKDSSFLSIKI